MERASAASAGPGEGHTATTQTESAADKEWGDLSRGTEAEAPGASLRGDSQGLGYLDKSKIDRVVKKHAHKVESCYLQGLEQSVEPFGGKLSVKFTIDVDGRVTSAEARESSLGNSGVEECIVEHFLMWRFPEPEGDGVVTVTYPFVFTPGRMRPQRNRSAP